AGRLPSGDYTAERLDLLANAAGEPNFLVDAAILSLASGDRFGAGARLSLAIERGANPGSELLWDAGLHEILAARPDQGVGPAELRLLGDAAYLAGKSDLAELRWQAALERDPAGSWKTYASLGALAAERAARRAREAATVRRPSSEVDSWAEIGVGFDPGRRAEASPADKPAGGLASNEERLYYERLLAAFPADGEAKAAYASFLVRDGREAEAAALLGQDDPASLGSRGARAKLAAESLVQPEERVVALAISLAALRDGDGDFLAEAMRLLLARRRWADFLALRDSAAARGLSFPASWYYDAVASALRGDGRAAVSLLEKNGPANPGPEAALALGLIYSREGELGTAEARLEVAGDAARDGKELCSVLKARGFLYRKTGDAARARAAFNAAAAADPDDAEAKILARTP
ncbi:MAG: hypothetical protein JNG85_07675, partial [Spirochaetaceae bacterium]|nr:hypothetical protein [Spirochaetaceae bacterium]